MEEGDKNVGGLQPNPINTTAQNVGPQPTTFGTAIQPERPAIPAQPNPIQRNIQSAFPYHPNSSASYAAGAIQQPIQQASQFQQFSSQPTTTNAGDIVLLSAPTKKSKRGLIIGILILIILLAIAGVGFWFFNQKSNNYSEYTNETDLQVFNRFINYYTDNENSPEDFEPLNNDNIYAAKRILYSSSTEEKRDYFSQLYNLWQIFRDKYTPTGSDVGSLEKVDDYLSLLYLYVDKGFISDKTLLDEYIKGGDESVRAYCDEYYVSDIKRTDAINSFLFLQSEHVDILLSVLDTAKEKGCIKEGVLDTECLSQSGITGTYQYEKLSQFEGEIRQYISQSEADLRESIVKLSYSIKETE